MLRCLIPAIRNASNRTVHFSSWSTTQKFFVLAWSPLASCGSSFPAYSLNPLLVWITGQARRSPLFRPEGLFSAQFTTPSPCQALAGCVLVGLGASVVGWYSWATLEAPWFVLGQIVSAIIPAGILVVGSMSVIAILQQQWFVSSCRGRIRHFLRR